MSASKEYKPAHGGYPGTVPPPKPAEDHTLRVLKGARELLSDPARWTVGTLWRKDDGERTETRSEACSFCLLGAVGASEIDLSTAYTEATESLRDTLEERGMSRHVSEFNDAQGRTHAQVLALIDETIRRVQGAQA